MSGYIGRTPLSEAIQSRAKYTATANQTTFSFSYQPGFLDVYLNGIKIEDTTDYTATTGTEIVLTSGAAAGDVLEAVGLSTFSLLTGKHNYSATAAPTTGDDSADGYRVGSMWIDTTNDEAYRCVDDTVGAAVWIGTTLETTDLGSLAMVTPTGTGSTSTFLRGDNSWTTVNTDLVADTTPQLGGDLDTNGSDVNFGDNDKAKFGASNDLQIYHDGGSSVIHDSGTGHLRLRANDLRIRNEANTADLIQANQGAEVTLYHNGDPKINTASSGINVTGTVTADGLTVDGTGTLEGTCYLRKDSDQAQPQVRLQTTKDSYATSWAIGQRPGNLGFAINAHNVGVTGWKSRFHIDEDGTTKFFSNSGSERMRIDSSGRVTMPYQPAFHVGTNTSYSSGQYIVWNVVKTNIGSHYNSSNGRFTAPVAGTYFFGLFMMTNGNGTLDVAMRVNGVDTHHLVPYQSALGNTHNAAGGSAVVQLNAGDYVSVKNNNTTIYHHSAGRHHGWCGYLIG